MKCKHIIINFPCYYTVHNIIILPMEFKLQGNHFFFSVLYYCAMWANYSEIQSLDCSPSSIKRKQLARFLFGIVVLLSIDKWESKMDGTY